MLSRFTPPPLEHLQRLQKWLRLPQEHLQGLQKWLRLPQKHLQPLQRSSTYNAAVSYTHLYSNHLDGAAAIASLD